jgi:hypothetical protein
MHRTAAGIASQRCPAAVDELCASSSAKRAFGSLVVVVVLCVSVGNGEGAPFSKACGKVVGGWW